MSNYDANTAISKADALCDKAATCYISNPKEALVQRDNLQQNSCALSMPAKFRLPKAFGV
jgi:hypothetical protein